jgi:hypothetical protein
MRYVFESCLWGWGIIANDLCRLRVRRKERRMRLKGSYEEEQLKIDMAGYV